MPYEKPTLQQIQDAVEASACLRKFQPVLANIIATVSLYESPPIGQLIDLWRLRKSEWFYS
ncbi:hypothetical protein [Lacipirellula parvula]|uniref:Uncharacterized protein n=1 Tax=Lacipirellula parvula TaxID=2650471 RepID=A0A5K7XJ25_9BACT|nr:hypothetical protein [Lacipirellula parvula]BBO34213.1 hypothetical protein PLANPX_3825 [Lacipirellula parvula]